MSKKRLTAGELERKSYEDTLMIQTYKKQISQLAACIADREARIERRKPIIAKIDAREQAEFQARLERAQTRANKEPLQVGKTYGFGDGMIKVAHARDLYLLLLPSGQSVMAGKDLVNLSESFFFEYPGASIVG